MALKIRLGIAALLLFCINKAQSQVEDSIYYERLYYACKTWGYAKYFHSEIANGSVDWDDVLLESLEGFRNAPNQEAFNDSLLVMLQKAGESQQAQGDIPIVPDSLNNSADLAWIQSEYLSMDVRKSLELIRSRFRPQGNVYVSSLGSRPDFGVDDKYFDGAQYPDEALRILAIVRYWNIIQYFFPYKDIMDQDWDESLKEFIPQIVEAGDALGYHLAFKEFTTRIDDSHAFFNSSTFSNWNGSTYPPFSVQQIEGEMVIINVLPTVQDIKPGDVIVAIDGEDIYSLKDRLRKYIHGSNEDAIERNLNSVVLLGNVGFTNVTVDDGNQTKTVNVARNTTNFGQLNFDNSLIWEEMEIGACSFGIVDMGRLETWHVDDLFEDFSDKDAIIFDIRNYPNNTIFHIVNYIYPGPVSTAFFTASDITYPGTFNWVQNSLGYGTGSPYEGQIIMLFDVNTQSHAEYTCMGLEQYPNTLKIGSTTAGADGNVDQIYLPGQIQAYASFLGVYYPDYSPTQRVGIIPDIELRPTIEGIRAGRDELMEAALSCIVDVNDQVTEEPVKVFPNPVADFLTVDLAHYKTCEYHILDLEGKLLSKGELGQSKNSIDMTFFDRGIYLLRIQTEERTELRRIVKM